MRTPALVLLVLVHTVAACGGNGSAAEGPLTPEEARATSGKIAVTGSLIAIEGEPVRLCSAILESYPPQCGEPSLEVQGLDLDSLDLASTRPGDEVTPARWSHRPIEVTGTVEDGVLVAS